MGLPQRRLLACVAILAFLALWIWAAATIGGMLPQQPLILMIYYGVVGIGWGIPILPVISWSENYAGRKRGALKQRGTKER